MRVIKKINNKCTLYIDKYSEAFAGGTVVIPTITFHRRKSHYFQYTFSWLKISYSFTFFK